MMTYDSTYTLPQLEVVDQCTKSPFWSRMETPKQAVGDTATNPDPRVETFVLPCRRKKKKKNDLTKRLPLSRHDIAGNAGEEQDEK